MLEREGGFTSGCEAAAAVVGNLVARRVVIGESEEGNFHGAGDRAGLCEGRGEKGDGDDIFGKNGGELHFW